MKATAAAVIAVGVATAAATAASYDPGFLAAPSIKQVAAATTDPWDRVREQLDTFRDSKYFNFSKFAFSAGDVTGRKFEYTDAHVTLEQRLLLASASKFPSACAIAGAVADGHLAFDTKASEVSQNGSRELLHVKPCALYAGTCWLIRQCVNEMMVYVGGAIGV
eukprot:INCI6204.5.p1 GENE.INCI6204.5~~INCI6204.5.p1  ORF type:complete len:164 (+),score=33.36 INCI6204.5:163-654(+)